MRSLIALATVVCICLSAAAFCGCGKKADESKNPTAATAPGAKPGAPSATKGAPPPK